MTRRRLFRILASLTLVWAAARPAGAEPLSELYGADAIVTGTDMRQRPWGFAQCLTEVLVKVSGDPRLRDDPRVAALADHADQYVAAFDYADLMAGIKKKDDQGSYDRPHRLTVRFDPAKIDGILATLGDRPWRGERPVVVPVLLVRGPKPPPYVLSADIPAGDAQRGSFATWAGAAGLKVRFPSDAEFAAGGISVEHFPGETSPPRTGARANDAVVIGTLDWNETLPGWVGAWRLRWRGADHQWGISGVNYDAAFRDIVRGVELIASGNGEPDRAGN
jgi:hypothetical protein